jgi:hypothetical protein
VQDDYGGPVPDHWVLWRHVPLYRLGHRRVIIWTCQGKIELRKKRESYSKTRVVKKKI